MTTETQQTETNSSADGIPAIDPRLIQELFDKDPLSLTNADLDVIIGEFRAGRMAYLNPPKEEAKAKGGKAKKASLDLDALGLGGIQVDIEDLLGAPKA